MLLIYFRLPAATMDTNGRYTKTQNIVAQASVDGLAELIILPCLLLFTVTKAKHLETVIMLTNSTNQS